MEMYVRLKPRAQKKRQGVPQTPERYMFQGMRFSAEKGWYKLDNDALVAELKRLTHNDRLVRDGGVLIFDVATKAEALQIERDEKRAKITRNEVLEAETATVANAVAVRTRARSGAVSSADIKPEAAAAAETDEEEMLDPDPNGDELEGDDEDDGPEAIGKLDEEDGEEPEASPAPRTRKAPAKAAKAAPQRATRRA